MSEPEEWEAPDTEPEAEEYPRWRGKATEWQGPSGKGPARFKIGGVKVQVWKYEYESEEVNPSYLAARDLAEEGAFVEAYGEEKPNSFYSTQAKKDITTTQRTVYGIEKAERAEGEDDPKPVGPSARKATGGAPRKGSGGKPDTLTKEEWAEKDRLQHAAQSTWAAFKIIVPLAKELGFMTDDGKNVDPAALERGVRGLAQLANKLIHDRTLFPERNLSTSGSTTASPAPAESPSPQSETPAPASKKPSAKKKSGSDG